MTRQEYAEYVERVAEFFASEGIENLSTGGEGLNIMPYFSRERCDCCRRSTAGDRYEASGYNREDDEVRQYTICEDCVYFAEYGRLDDQTMWDIEHSEK